MMDLQQQNKLDEDQKKIRDRRKIVPPVKPSDIIEKSIKTSGDWLTRDLEKKFEEEQERHEKESKREEGGG